MTVVMPNGISWYSAASFNGQGRSKEVTGEAKASFLYPFHFKRRFGRGETSAGVMGTVLFSTNNAKIMHFTGVMVGFLLVFYITFETPVSGMSMNPARTIGSATVANVWTGCWVYLLTPPIGMLLAAEIYLWTKGKDAVHCAKLHHTLDVRCIFKCGYHEQMMKMENQETQIDR